jgi:CheY-like chemotaxis protein
VIGQLSSEQTQAFAELQAATDTLVSELSLALVRIWVRSPDTKRGVAIACSSAVAPHDSASSGGLTPEAVADVLRAARPEPERSNPTTFDARFRGALAAPYHLGAVLFRNAAPVAYLEAYSENPVEAAQSAKARESLTRFFLSEAAIAIPTGTIVVAEDDATTRAILTRMLRRNHYRVIDVENGKQACEAVTEEQPDLLLLDWSMPVMDGRETATRLKTDPSTRTIPIVMLTAHSQIEDKIGALESGVQDFITKPFDERDLVARIDGHMIWRSRLGETGDARTPLGPPVALEHASGLTPSETEIPTGVVPIGDAVWRAAVAAASVGNLAETVRLFLAEAEVCDAGHRYVRAAVAYRSASIAAAQLPNMRLSNKLMSLAGKMFATAADTEHNGGEKQKNLVNAARCFLACAELALAKHALDAALAE